MTERDHSCNNSTGNSAPETLHMSVASEGVDRVVEIERLAALDLLDYDVARKPAAEQLGLSLKALDAAVNKKRRLFRLDEGDAVDGPGRAVSFADPLPWHEAVDGDVLANMLARAVKTYVVVPDTVADAIALWTLGSWLVNSFPIAPRLAITSPTKGCGKTTVLRVLNVLARRPKRAGSISPSALFRVVEQFQPTLLLDETEKFVEPGSDLHALLNEGHAKGGTVLRVLGERQELREFSVFGAVAFCRNGRLPDDLEQRSIVIEMQRRLPDEPLAELRDDRCEPLQRLARMCARWSDDHAADLRGADPDMDGLINRTGDNWRPSFAIADVIGGDWPERARKAAAELAARETDSIGTMLLADIKAVFAEKGTDRLPSAVLVEALHAIEGRPWPEFGRAGKPISPNQLARLLKPFGISPGTIRMGAGTAKGYFVDQFLDDFARYLAPQGAY